MKTLVIDINNEKINPQDIKNLKNKEGILEVFFESNLNKLFVDFNENLTKKNQILKYIKESNIDFKFLKIINQICYKKDFFYSKIFLFLSFTIFFHLFI